MEPGEGCLRGGGLIMKVCNYQAAATKQERDHGRNVYTALCPFCRKATTAKEDEYGNLHIKAADKCEHFANIKSGNAGFTFMNETIHEDQESQESGLRNNEVEETRKIAGRQASIDSFGGA